MDETRFCYGGRIAREASGCVSDVVYLHKLNTGRNEPELLTIF